MEEYLKNFELVAKNPLEDALWRWRNAQVIVKNRKRRFRKVTNLGIREDIKRNIDAEPEIHETEVDDQNIETPNEDNVENTTVRRPDDHQCIDVEKQEEEVIEQRTANNSEVEEDPANGDLAARLKLGSKIGSFAAGTSVAGTIPVFTNSGNYHEKNLYDKLLLGASLLFMLVSFVSGVALLQGRPLLNFEIFPMNNPKSIGRHKFVTRVATVSITIVMIFGLALIIRRAY